MRSLIRWSLRLCLFNALLVTGALAGEHGSGGGSEGGEKGGKANEYMDIKPALITNYGGPGPIHFLKAEITLRLSKTADAAETVAHHLPRIRHELIMLLSRQSEENLESMQGKEQLRQDALAAVQKVMKDESGNKNVEDLLFTNFVIQH